MVVMGWQRETFGNERQLSAVTKVKSDGDDQVSYKH